MKRKLLSVLLSLAMVLTMMPVFAMAEDTPGGGTSGEEASSTEVVAKIGDETYPTLNAAVAAATAGKETTITMLKDTTEAVVIGSDKIIVLDLDGHNITAPTDKNYDAIANSGKLTIRDSKKNGEIISKKNHGISVDSNSNTTIEYANIQGQEGAVCGYNTTNGAEVTINDGVFEGKDNAVVIFNGADRDGEANKVTINGGIFNGEIQSKGYIACGIYAPWKDKITVNGGTFDIKGGAGIVARAGNVTITGGEFKTTTNNTTVEKGIGKVGDSRVVVPCSALVFDSEADYPALTVDSNIAVTGGIFTSEVDTVSFIKKDTDNNNRIVISGGTFSSDVNKYCVENYVTEKNNDNTYTVKSLEDVAVAQIGKNDLYKTIEDAVDKANDGDTVKLLKDIELNDLCPIKKNITLDLGNKTLSGNGSILDIYGNVTIKNGNIKIPSSEEETGAVWVNKTAKLTVENSVTIDVPDNSFAIGYWSDCTTAEVNFKGSITGGNGITMNGMITDTNTNNILILDGAKINVKGHGVYQAGYSKTSFSANNSEIRGVTGIEVRAGDLTVTNSIISGSNDKAKFSCKPNGNGTTTDGVGIAIAQHTTKLPINVTISGGEISGVYAIYESNPQNNGSESVKEVKLSVNDGKFTGDIYSKDITGFISGGYFTSDPTKYLATSTEGGDKKCVAEASKDPSYVYKVVQVGVDYVPVVPAVGGVKVSLDADKLGKDVKNAAENVEAEKIDVAAAEVANKISPDAANKYIEDAKAVTDPEKIEVRAYLDITPKAYNDGNDGNNAVYTLEITPKYDIVVVGGENTAANNEKVVGSGTLNVTNETNITVQLPVGFVTDANTLYVQHKGHEYDATVTKNTENGVDIYTASFTNPDGFSEFTISKTTQAVAKIGDKKYTSLQAAVDAVEDGQIKTITVTKDNERASVSGNKSFIIEKGTGVSEVKLTAASGYNLTDDGNGKYTFSPRNSSSGSSSGSSSTTYTVTVGSVSNGTVTSSHKSAASGATVTLTVKPADGYAVEAVAAKDAKGNAVKVTEKDGKYTFAMPASNVTVSASFVKKGEQPAAKLFDDVAQGAYYYDAVKWAVDKGVTNGKTSNLFGSEDPCTRAQIVTFLWRAAGSPAASASVSFTDVKDSDYYAKAVAWAVEKGITNGTGDGKFSSDDTCTRAQCAAFLYRAAGSPEVTDAAAFSDVAADAYYAKAVAWAEKNGITNGLGNGKFGSDNSCTRAQIITFLYRTYQGK